MYDTQVKLDLISQLRIFSATLPARFVLKLSSPMVVSLESCREIEKMTSLEFANENESAPLMQLITKSRSKGVLDTANSRGLFVVSQRTLWA